MAAARGGAPVYLLRRGDVVDRASIEAKLAGECNAGGVSAGQIAAAFAAGIETLMAGDVGADAILRLRLREDRGQRLTPEELGALAGAREVLTEHWPSYRALMLRMERRRLVLPVVAFSHLCVGWTGLTVEYRRWPSGRIDPWALNAVPVAEIGAAGHRAYTLLPSRG